MEKPFIFINGQKIEPVPPRMKVWRLFLQAADRDFTRESLEDFMDAEIRLIIETFGRPDIVNEKSIEDNLEIAEVVPLVRSLFQWIQSLTFEKLAAVPNEETGRV